MVAVALIPALLRMASSFSVASPLCYIKNQIKRFVIREAQLEAVELQEGEGQEWRLSNL